MGIAAFFQTEDAGGVEGVDTDFGACVEDFPGSAHHADVGDVAVVVLEEGEVADFGLVHEINRGTAGHLLGCVARNRDIDAFIDDLCETGAVDAGGGATAPKVGRLQVSGGKLQKAGAQIRLRGGLFRQINLEGGSAQSHDAILRKRERRADEDGEAHVRSQTFHKKEDISHDIFRCGEIFVDLFIGIWIVQAAVDPAHIIAVVRFNLQPLGGFLQNMVGITEEELRNEFRAVRRLGTHTDNR